jgi:hypothetical protein
MNQPASSTTDAIEDVLSRLVSGQIAAEQAGQEIAALPLATIPRMSLDDLMAGADPVPFPAGSFADVHLAFMGRRITGDQYEAMVAALSTARARP